MNTETGQLYEGNAIKKAKDVGKVRVMTNDDRKAYAKRVLASRKQRKQKRTANRKRRGRR